MRLRPPDFQSTPHWAGGAVPTEEIGLLRDHWQNAGLQYAIFLKVNNKTIAVRHQNRPWRPQGQEGSRRVPGAGMALLQRSALQAPIGGSPSLNWPALQTTLGEEVETRWGASLPQQGSATPASRSSWPCLVDLHSQAPCSKHLSVPLQTVISCTGIQLPGNLPSGGYGEQTGPDLFPPLESALKITQVATQRS